MIVFVIVLMRYLHGLYITGSLGLLKTIRMGSLTCTKILIVHSVHAKAKQNLTYKAAQVLTQEN